MNNFTAMIDSAELPVAREIDDPCWNELRQEARDMMVEIITCIDLDRYWRTLERRTANDVDWKRLVRENWDDDCAWQVLQDELEFYCECVVENHRALKADQRASRKKTASKRSSGRKLTPELA